MKGLKLIGIFLATVIMIVLSRTPIHAEYHHVDDCTVCHYAGLNRVDCTGSANLVHIRDLLDTPCSDLRQTVFGPFVLDVPPYNGVCQVCHESVGACATKYYRHDGSGDDHPVYKPGSMGPTDCNVCHKHAPYEFGHEGSVGTGCDACHGLEGGAGTVQSHGTHTKVDGGKGPHVGCPDCHDVNNFPRFADGAASLAATTACDNCHSPGGAFDGVNDSGIGAKVNWADGIYEVDGNPLKSGQEQWCAGCHDDDPAYSNKDGEMLSASTYVEDTHPECTFDPAWNHVTGNNAYGTHFLYKEPGDGSSTVTWTPNIPISGRYDVLAWNPHETNRGNVTYTVNHASGSTEVPIDQSSVEEVWVYIGTFEFNAGTSGSVVLPDLGDGMYISGDAIKWVLFGGGARAPSVVGDNATYGFYVTGHGRDKPVECLTCHDAQTTHIDGEHRTYDLDGLTVVHPYNEGYRLPEKSMINPRPVGNNAINTRDFALCFGCHNCEEMLGEDFKRYDYSHTNFWDDEATQNWLMNAHQYHIWKETGNSDSDYDGTKDSRASCVTCHNVHGPPNPAMIRHGELISTPGTTDKVPALNFSYRKPRTENYATATFTSPALSTAGDYNVYAWWTSHKDYANHAGYTIYHDGAESPAEVVKGHKTDGGQWNLLGTYPYNADSTGTVVLDNDYAWGGWLIADAVKWEEVANPANTVIVDNAELGTTFVNDHHTWETYDVDSGSGSQDLWGTNLHRIDSHWLTLPDPSPSLATSAGGWMEHEDTSVAGTGVCSTCHIPHHALYVREPKLWPKVIAMPGAVPSTVASDGTGTSLVTVLIADPDDNATSVTIDLSPFGGSAAQVMNDNGDGTYSYLVNVPAGLADGNAVLLEVTAADADTNTGTGRIWITPVIDGAIYVDDLDAVFYPDCLSDCQALVEWAPSSAFPDQQFNGRYKVIGFQNGTGTGTRTATWTPNVPTSGNYEVSAWWVHANVTSASTNTPYTIYYDGGSQRVEVDQTVNGPGGGKWNVLGAYPFAAGTSGHIVMSDDATDSTGTHTYIVADGTRLVPVP